MRYIRILALALCLTALAGLVVPEDSEAARLRRRRLKPNVIVFLTDDQGWTGTSVAMDPSVPGSSSDFYETPQLERLAADGIRFTSGYAPAPNCSPTRASVQTGVSPAALQLTCLPRVVLPAGTTTIAEAVKAADPSYVTAHFGKWHLGGGDPGAHGFDVHDGNTGGFPPSHDPDTNPKDVFGMSFRAAAFMAEQVAAGLPFYMQLSHYAPHVPEEAQPSTIAKYASKPPGAHHDNVGYAAMTEDLDTSLGGLLDAIDDLGIKGRTYLLYTSDNGGQDWRGLTTTNVPLAGGKTTLWEGGIRVPWLVRGPGIEGGVVSTVPVIGWDILPTVLDWIGASGGLASAVEGGSLKPLLEDEGEGNVNRPRDELVWHFPHSASESWAAPHSAIRSGRYKGIKFYSTGQFQLYDLIADPGETQDLADQLPGIAQNLEQDLLDYLQEVNADPPSRCRSCGLGSELVFLLPPLMWLHRRRRRKSA